MTRVFIILLFVCSTIGCSSQAPTDDVARVCEMLRLAQLTGAEKGSLPRLLRDIPDGLGVAALLGAIFIAAMIESAFWLLSNLRADIIESGLPITKTVGEQSDEREPE